MILHKAGRPLLEDPIRPGGGLLAALWCAEAQPGAAMRSLLPLLDGAWEGFQDVVYGFYLGPSDFMNCLRCGDFEQGFTTGRGGTQVGFRDAMGRHPSGLQGISGAFLHMVGRVPSGVCSRCSLPWRGDVGCPQDLQMVYRKILHELGSIIGIAGSYEKRS